MKQPNKAELEYKAALAGVFAKALTHDISADRLIQGLVQNLTTSACSLEYFGQPGEANKLRNFVKEGWKQ